MRVKIKLEYKMYMTRLWETDTMSPQEAGLERKKKRGGGLGSTMATKWRLKR